MTALPIGTVAFLFTDMVDSSTPRRHAERRFAIPRAFGMLPRGIVAISDVTAGSMAGGRGMAANADERVIIAGARIVDGSGNPWFSGDIVLHSDTIGEIAPAGRAMASTDEETIDATGMVACPGFIDIQSHSIVAFLTDRRSLSKITQGVTTEIMGEAWTPSPFGGRIEDPFREDWAHIPADQGVWLDLARSWTRFGDWLRWLEAEGVSVNVGSFVGGATVRERAKGWPWAPPTTLKSWPCRRCSPKPWPTAPLASPPR